MKMSPMMTHYLQLKERHKDCILFYRLGDFYEMFFEDAQIVSKELELTLTARSCGLEEKAPMCGVPYHAADAYIKKLIEKDYKIAICEQLSEAKAGQMVDRDIVRIVTTGTLTESSMLDKDNNNYIMCIYQNLNTISYTYCDISTGELKSGIVTGNNFLSEINDQIVRINPKEIICNNELKNNSHELPSVFDGTYKTREYYEWCFSQKASIDIICRQYHINNIVGHDFAEDGNILISIGALFQYLFETQKKQLNNISFPIIESYNDFMYIDAVSRKNLELEDNKNKRTQKDTLLWVMDNTKTSMGKRLIKNWLRQPLQNEEKINDRLNKTEAIYNNKILLKALQELLFNIQDIERFSSKIAVNTITPRDCVNLAKSLEIVPNIQKCILNLSIFTDLFQMLNGAEYISNLINDTINNEAPIILKDGHVFNKNINETLDHYRELQTNTLQIISKMEYSEREKSGIKSLKIGYNKIFGYYIEINKQYLQNVPYNYIRKQTIANGERFVTEELKTFENELLSAEDSIFKLETEMYQNFKNELLNYVETLKTISKGIGALDCIVSFASIANDYKYVRPIITKNNIINIKNGRHPVIEKKVGVNNFITNNTLLNDNAEQILIITGPNMAGKSTFMRQTALIVIMAQMGSFVPAEYAEISITDRIFTRIGASDDLSNGQSTFMVEMTEVANILNNTTDKSLLLLDEVGRGTSTYDGLSIAWSVVEHIAYKTRAKTLFATHYHELTEIESKMTNVKNYRVTIKEIGGEIVFLRKIERGGAIRSFGIEVASLAGLPKSLIDNAKLKLKKLEKSDVNSLQKNDKNSLIQPNVNSEKISNILKQTSINETSPLKALEILEYLKNLDIQGGVYEN